MAGSIQYIKISKIDKTGVDLTTQLESINTLVLPSGSSFAEYTIKNKSRFKDYFLYYVTPPDRNNISNDITSSLKYDFTGSLGGVGSEIDLGVGGVAVPYPTLTGTTGSKSITYDTTQERIQLTTLPQKDLHLRTSTFFVTSSAEVFVELFKADSVLSPGSITRLTTSTAIQAGGIKGPFTRQLSITGSNTGDVFFVGATADSFPFSGGPFVSVSGPLDGLKLTPFNIFISSSAATGDNLQTIIEPYFTTDFYRSEYDVLQNNATKGIPNQLLQNVDYNSGIIPTNIEAIMSGSAVKADIPQSNYEISSLINPSYNRSLVQSSNVNVYDPLARGTDFGDSVNIGTYGQTPSISDLDTNIYEFEWGGGTTPEILDYGAVKLGKILQVSSPDQVKTINASDGIYTDIIASQTGFSSIAITRNYRVIVSDNSYPPSSVATSSVPQAPGFLDKIFWLTSQSRGDYYQILNKNNPVNHEITMNMYPNSTAGSNPTLPATTRILTTEWGVPTISSYALTSSNPTHYGRLDNVGTTSFIKVSRSLHISKVTTDSNGFYQSGKNPIKPNWATIGDQINRDLNNGERWFVTLYNEFEFPNNQGDYNSVLTTGSLSPYNEGNTGVDSNGNYNDPLAYKGVFEIAGTYDEGGLASGDTFNFVMYNSFPTSADNKLIGGGASGNSLGMLLWKARAIGKNEFVIVQDEISGGVQEGAFTSRFTPSYITENFESITKTYGTNQTG